MAAALVLNDLSYSRWNLDLHETLSCVQNFSKALNGIRKIRIDCFLLSAVRLRDIPFGEGQWLTQLVNEPSIRDEVRVLLSFANRSPYGQEDCEADGAECRFQGSSAQGLLFAKLLNGFAVSFPSAREWKDHSVEVDFSELLGTEEAPEIVSSMVSIPHISSTDHVTEYAERILTFGIGRPESGMDIWNQRVVLFPSLKFLSGVENQLNQYAQADLSVQQIFERLTSLDVATREWHPDVDAFPPWRSKVTPEGTHRKQLCLFRDENGVEHVYDLHARFTPGAGRIHFRLLHGDQMIEVAYIGLKL